MLYRLFHILESNIKKYKDEKSLQETGIVLSMSEGIARYYGLINKKIKGGKNKNISSIMNNPYVFYMVLLLILLINTTLININLTECAPGMGPSYRSNINNLESILVSIESSNYSLQNYPNINNFNQEKLNNITQLSRNLIEMLKIDLNGGSLIDPSLLNDFRQNPSMYPIPSILTNEFVIDAKVKAILSSIEIDFLDHSTCINRSGERTIQEINIISLFLKITIFGK